MVVEEVRYDFEGFEKYADDFIHDLVRLMIISKMNSTMKGASSREYFVNLIKQIEGCEAYIVKYGQPILYAKYKGMEFTDQKISTQFVRQNKYAIDVTMESVFGEFVKTFDNLASGSQNRVKWGQVQDTKPDPLFVLLNAFVDGINRLSHLDPTNQDSLMGKRFGIKNVNITKQSTHLEFLVDGRLNILLLNPAKKKKDDVVIVLLGEGIANAIASLMKQ